MSRLSDVTSKALINLIGYACLTPVVLAINAGGAATIKTTGTMAYTNNGLFKTKAALAAQSLAITHDARGNPGGAYVQPAGTTVYYVVALDAAGAVKVIQGSYEGQKYQTDPTKGVGAAANMGTSWGGTSDVPEIPDGFTPIGMIKVVTGGAVTFTPGTTALDAANIAFTFMDVCVLPAGRP